MWYAPLAAFALAAVACGGDPSTPTVTTDGADLSTAENAINPMSRDRVQDGGTLTWPIDAMPVNFNVYELDGTDQDSQYIAYAQFLGPFTTDAGGTPVWNPSLLASEPTLVTEPRQVVTYEIHPDASWYDGTPITWEDFYWQWRATNGTDSAYVIASSGGYEAIEDVEMGGHEREVVVTFLDQFADWQNIFDPVLPATTNRDPEMFNNGWRERPLTSAGPFRFESLDRTAQTITLVRNERWWGPPAKLDQIIFRTIEIDAQIDALANGEIDLMDVGTDASKYTRAQRIAGVEARIAGGPLFGHITMNGASPVLLDVRVRRALAMGIDRAVIVRALLVPLGFEPRTLGNHIFMPNHAAYQDNSADIGAYNPERASRLLDEAGWVLEAGVRSMDDQPLEISFVIPGGVATSQQTAELVQNMLGQIGVAVNIQVVPIADFFAQYVSPGQFDLTVFSWGGTPYPISTTKSIYGQPTTNANGELEIQQNYARIGSDEIDRLYAEANAELDRETAIALANRIDGLIWQEVHSLALYQRPEIYMTKEDLANFGPQGFQHPLPYQDMGWALEE